MLGIRFIRFQPTQYVLHYSSGKLRAEGPGLAFFYYAPTTSLVAVPVGSAEVPFIFEEITADFQQITIQGSLTYRISDPKKTAALLNFTVDPRTQLYLSDDPVKLPQRLINVVKVLNRQGLQGRGLREALAATDPLSQAVRQGVNKDPELLSLGIEVLGYAILAIKPTPETSRALEAETRESLLKQSDEAIYARRNSAVEQERAIRENELNTEIAVETKKRQIRETQMEAERSIQEKQHALSRAEMGNEVELERQKQQLVELAVANARQDADAKAYAMERMLGALAQADPRLVQALTNSGMTPDQMIALAFQEMAGRADKIGELNISPDLLRELMKK